MLQAIPYPAAQALESLKSEPEFAEAATELSIASNKRRKKSPSMKAFQAGFASVLGIEGFEGMMPRGKKGKGKGKGKKRRATADLPRERIAETPVTGELAERKSIWRKTDFSRNGSRIVRLSSETTQYAQNFTLDLIQSTKNCIHTLQELKKSPNLPLGGQTELKF